MWKDHQQRTCIRTCINNRDSVTNAIWNLCRFSRINQPFVPAMGGQAWFYYANWSQTCLNNLASNIFIYDLKLHISNHKFVH